MVRGNLKCYERILATVLALVVLSVACASGNKDEAEINSAEINVAQSDGNLIEALQNSVSVSDTTTTSALSSLPDPRLDQYLKTAGLEGMYGWTPAGGFPDAAWQGTLVVEPPCVFIDLSAAAAAATTTTTTTSESRVVDSARVFLRLPEPLTRYEYESGNIWVGDHGPMLSGDLVEVIGSAGRPIDKNADSAKPHDFVPSAAWGRGCHANGSFWTTSLRPLPQNQGELLDVGELLAGLFSYHVGMAHPDIGIDMVLLIEPPCVFVVPISVWESRDENSSIQHRYFLRLPRPLVRFDAASNSLWVGDDGPMTTGDYVELNDTFQRSENGSELYEKGCFARGRYQTPWLRQITGLRLQDLDCVDRVRQDQAVIPLAPCARRAQPPRISEGR